MLLPNDKTPTESNLAIFIEDFLDQHSIDYKRDHVTDDRFNIEVDFFSPKNKQLILITAHMDTVPPHPLQRNPFSAIEKNGKVFGLGACDNKSSIAVLLSLILKMRDGFSKNLKVVFTVDEEYGLTGAQQLASRDIYFDFAIACEPSSLGVFSAQKGTANFEVSLNCEQVHSVDFWNSKNNVVTESNRLIETFMQRCATLNDLNPHVVFDGRSIAPTSITSKGARNSSGKHSKITFDYRYLPGDDPKEFIDNIISSFEGASLTEYEVSDEPFFSDLNNPELMEFRKVLNLTLGSAKITWQAYGSEASILKKISKNVVVFGPGNPQQCHSPDEWVELSQMEQALSIYSSFLQ